MLPTKEVFQGCVALGYTCAQLTEAIGSSEPPCSPAVYQALREQRKQVKAVINQITTWQPCFAVILKDILICGLNEETHEGIDLKLTKGALCAMLDPNEENPTILLNHDGNTLQAVLDGQNEGKTWVHSHIA